MKKFITILLLSIILFSCRGYDYPTIEESEEIISNNSKIIDSLNIIIQDKKPIFDSKSDVVFSVSNNFINKILQSYTNSKTEDIFINVNESKSVYEENRKILGLTVKDYIDIHSGVISTDIKKVRFEKSYNNRMEALLEIEGKGNVSVSGKIMGVPFPKLNPPVEFYLNEPVMFDVLSTKDGSIEFKPLPKNLLLKARIPIKISDWYLPLYKEIPIESNKLIESIEMPLGFETEFSFPVPNSNLESEKMALVPYNVNLEQSNIKLDKDRIEFKANLIFKKK